MIGFDDLLDGYLPSENEENPEISDENKFIFNNLNFKQIKNGQIGGVKEEIVDLEVEVISSTIEDIFELDKSPSYTVDTLSPLTSKIETLEDYEAHDSSENSLVFIEPESELSSDSLVCEIDSITHSCNLSDITVISHTPEHEAEFCKICNSEDEDDPEFLLICYGCGEAFHRKCLGKRARRIKCGLPIIFRDKIADSNVKRYSHAPWYCNNCVKCSCCGDGSGAKPANPTSFELKDSFVACRHCGKVSCLACYNAETFNDSNFTHQLSRFENLQNYSCPGCLQCINCGLDAAIPKDPFTTKTRRRASICKSMTRPPASVINLYKDSTLCRPCYLSEQIGCVCPRCKQIYHHLHDHYDFGETPFNSEFSLCPMIMCDDCGSWTHRQCAGLNDEEYERLGTDNDAKFTCIDCSKMKKRPKHQIKTYKKDDSRKGNVISVAENEIKFNYWDFDEVWRRQTYTLSFNSTTTATSRFLLKFADKMIQSDSLNELCESFTELFQKSSSKPLKAVNPQLFLNPMSLLTILERNNQCKNKNNFLAYLQREILKLEGFSSARTESIFDVKDAHVKSLIPKNVPNVPLLSTIIPSSSSSSPTIKGSTGKFGLKYLYMQYSQAIRSDSSSYTIDSASQGLALRPSEIAGYGLFATKQFQKNALIIEYCGEMLSGDRLVDKRDAYYNSLGKRYQQSCYLFRLDELKVLDATHKGNLSRFINHSCSPNCYSRVVQIDDAKKLLIFASRIIEPGEEILYDYKFPDEEQKIPCLCGSEKCRKWMN